MEVDDSVPLVAGDSSSSVESLGSFSASGAAALGRVEPAEAIGGWGSPPVGGGGGGGGACSEVSGSVAAESGG